MQGREAAERKIGHIGDALACELVDERIIGAIGKIIEVLHADDGGDALCLCNLCRRHLADADMADQALALQFRQCFDLRRDGAFRRGMQAVHAAEIHYIQPLQPEVAQIVMHCLGEVRLGEGGQPAAFFIPPCPHLGHDDEILTVG